MGIFGWSYPPGAANDPNAPYNQTDVPLDLCDHNTIKGHGRRGHGLNGKDADLDVGGQIRVNEAWWFDSDEIQISGRRYASIVPGEEWTEAQRDIAQELVCDCAYPGEWDGDYWVLGENFTLTVPCAWNDEESDEANIARACQAAVTAIEADSAQFEAAMTQLNEDFTNINMTGDDNG